MRNWRPTWRRVAPSERRSPISERRSSTEMTITFAIPTPPTSSATAPSPRKSDGEGALRRRARLDRVGRAGDVHLVGRLGVDRACEHRAHVLDVLGVAPHVERRDVALVVEEAGGGAEPDERGAVERRDERHGVEDPDDGEPRAADDDLDPAAGPVDPEPAGSRRSQDHGGVAGRRVVEEDAVGERRAERGEQRRVGGERRDALRLRRPASAPTGTRWSPTEPVAETASTGPMRPVIARAVSGSAASSPKIVCPGEAVSRFVPSRSSDERRSALLDSEIARTATIAAIPIAIPSAESAARSRRAWRPTAPTRRTSRGGSRLGASSITRRARCRARRGRRAARPAAAARRRARGRG